MYIGNDNEELPSFCPYPWYLLCSLGILGDFFTHKYPRDIGPIKGVPIGVRWDRGTSIYPLIIGIISEAMN